MDGLDTITISINGIMDNQHSADRYWAIMQCTKVDFYQFDEKTMEREIIGWSNERLCLMWKSCKDIYKLVGISVASVIVLKRPFIDFLLTPASKMKIGWWLRDGRP